MGLLKKKKKKSGFGSKGTSSAGREQSPLRPRHAPKLQPCTNACPSGNDIRKFITAISQAELLGKTSDQAYEEAWYTYTNTSPFPGVCGRVCPHPCEFECNRTKLDGGVGVNKIERAIGNFGIEKNLKLAVLSEEKRDKKIAVIGAGPSGLSCAYQLARRGYGVTVFESLEKPGGMLRWGIPRYRLPAEILDKEIQKILDLGVELKLNSPVELNDIKEEYDAVYIGIGAQTGLKLRVEGEEAENVYSGVDFLNRINHGEKPDIGDNVIVVGGGNTAIDAARISKRLGAVTTILYRRTIKEMPAIEEEIEEAQNENIKLEYLAAPIGFVKEGNRIKEVNCIRMELGEPDSSGRRRPVPKEGSEFSIPATAVIAAISQAPDFSGFESLIEGKEWIKIDESGKTKLKNIYAGGDTVNLDIATTAIGHGRIAAETIDADLRGVQKEKEDKPPLIVADKMRLDHYDKKDRIEPVSLSIEERMQDIEVEANLDLPADKILEEAVRCMSCGQCFYCEKCWLFCQDSAVNKPGNKGELYTFKLENCTGCKKCAEECPCGFIDMV
ncbi:MAG: NAD(P)-binding protein [Chitinispirillia bacterium]|jgi:NADPH-dependent glutamate synthase beta subunit-like oxidoreductase